MSEFRWKLRHPDTGSAIEEWVLARRPDGTKSFTWTQWVVRWFPKLKRWRVQCLQPAGKTRTGHEYLKRVTLAEFPCDNLVMAFVGEEARAFAETTWGLKHDIVECSLSNHDRVEGETWWEPEQRLGHHRLCVFRKPWAEAMWRSAVPTGWSVSQEDRLDGQWMAMQFGTSKTVVGSKEDAMAYAEATYHLGNSVT